MKPEKAISEPRGVVQSFRTQPVLFIGSALGLLALAALKGVWGGKRAANGGK